MNVDDQLPNIEKIFKNEDEEFTPGGGSNLAAIFGNVNTENQDVLHVAKQTTQKKSSSKHKNSSTSEPTSQTTSKTEVIIATTVHAYKLQNGQYISAGKLGIALTGNVSTRAYQIILYKSKYEYISVVTLKKDFTYTVQPNNYSTYYDDNNENWSILFENKETSIKFARELAIAKYFLKEDKIENVIYQDLTAVNKDEVTKEGSRVTLKYFISTDIGQFCNINYELFQTMTVSITTDDSWERSLIGISKELKRILFIPSSKQISLGPGFPKDKDVFMEIEVTNVQEVEEQFSLSKPIVSGKALLLSRMAKMGQSILPKMQTPAITDSEDTEDDLPQQKPCNKKKELLEVPLQEKHTMQEIPATQSTREVTKSKHNVPFISPTAPKYIPNSTFIPVPKFVPTWYTPQLQSNYVIPNEQIYALQSQSLTQTVPTGMDSNVNLLLSETRIANSELRMGMSKVADNVQKVLDKFHNLELKNACLRENTTMENTLKLILNTLESDIKNKDIQKDLCCDHLYQLTKVRKEMFELENELKCTKELLSRNMEMTKTLEKENTSLSCINKELINKMNDMEVLLDKKNDEFDLKITELKKCLEVSKNENEKENEELKMKVSDLTAKLDSAKLEINAVSSNNNDMENRNKEIKYIINRAYNTLKATFTEESYNTEDIKKILFSTLKNITLQVLQEKRYLTEKESESETDLKNTSKNIEDNNEQSNKFPENPNSISLVEENVPPPIPPMDSELGNGIY